MSWIWDYGNTLVVVPVIISADKWRFMQSGGSAILFWQFDIYDKILTPKSVAYMCVFQGVMDDS